MTNQTKIKYALLAEWLRALELEGFVFGIDTQLQLQSIVEQLPEKLEIEALKLLLTPIFAQNEQEQELVYTVFDRALQRVRAIHQSSSNTSPSDSKKRLPWLLPAIVILLLFSGLLAVILFRPILVEASEFTAPSFAVNINLSDTICLDSSTIANIPDLELPIRSAVFCSNQNQTDSSIFARFQINNNLCLFYSAKDSVGLDSVCVEIYGQAEQSVSIYFRAIIENNVADTAQVVNSASIQEREVGRPLFASEGYPIDTDVLSLDIEELTGWRKFFSENIGWLKGLFYVLTAILLLLVLWIRERNRRELIAEKEQGTQPPHIWNIELKSSAPITLGGQFDSLLNSLRQRTTADQLVFDINRTVQSTIQEGGMINFEYSYRTRPPEYLLLIHRQNLDDHRAHWQDYLYHQFLENEVLVERFFYHHDPRLCWNEKYPDGLKIKDLQQLFPESRLLISGDAYSLLNATTGKVSKWIKVVELWKDRAIFTPIPTSDWGRRERVLEESFVVLPSSLQSLQFYVEQLDLGTEASFENWRLRVEDAATYPIQIKKEAGHIVEQFNIHFEEEILKWIAACCVYPSLHWDLTLQLGTLLSTDENNLLTTENINQLLQLPYFESGKIPNDIRSAFLEWLESKHPELLEQVRLELHQIFQQNPPPQDSIAWEDYHLNAAFNELLITTDNKRKQQLEAEIAQDINGGAEPDITLVKYLNRPKSTLDFIVPENWRKHVYKGGWSGLGFKEFEKDALWAFPLWLLLCALIWSIPDMAQECVGEEIIFANLVEVEGRIAVSDVERLEDWTEETIEYIFPENTDFIDALTLCMKDDADYILLNEYQARFALFNQQYDVVDSLTVATDSLYKNIDDRRIERKADSLWTAYLNNLSVDYWNLAIPYWERWDSLQDLSKSAYEQLLESGNTNLFDLSLSREEAADVQKDSSCFFFNLARQLDSLNDNRLLANIWCNQRQFSIQIVNSEGRGNDSLLVLKQFLADRGYELLNDLQDSRISNSEVQYYYEDDRPVASDILLELRNLFPNRDFLLVKEPLPIGPDLSLEGKIIIQIAAEEEIGIVSDDPPSVVLPSFFTIALYAYQNERADFQRILKYIRSKDYETSTMEEIGEPFSGMAKTSSILYYSAEGKVEAEKLKRDFAALLPTISFQVREGAGELHESLTPESSIIIHLIGDKKDNPNSDLEFYNATKLVEVLITEDDEQRRGMAFQFLLAKYSGNTEVIQRLLNALERERLNSTSRNTLLSFLFSTEINAWTYEQVQQARQIADKLGGTKTRSSEINRFQEFVADLSTKIQRPLPDLLTSPLQLYFAGDEPSSRSNSKTTNTSYNQLLDDFLSQRGNYLDAASNSARAVGVEQLRAEVNDFFENEVQGSFDGFQQLLARTQSYLEQGYNIQFCLLGSTDKSGTDGANLVSRRIESINNYIRSYNKGILEKYISSGRLVIQSLPPVLSSNEQYYKQTDLNIKSLPNLNPSYDLDAAKSNIVSFVSVAEKGTSCATY